MLRRSPLRAKRPTPRRNEGRVTHERMKPKRGAPPTAEQERYHDWLRKRVLKCECGCGRPGECIHHILPSSSRNHWRVVRLSHACHNGEKWSVHGLGSEAKFKERHSVDLVAISAARLKEYRGG